MRKFGLPGLLSALLLTAGPVACSDDGGDKAVCGNGIIEGAEVCDQDQLGGNTCTTIPGGFSGGTLACSNTCSFDTSQCSTGGEECGNGIIETGESCDGTALGDATCESVGSFVGGTLACTDECAFDTSLCEPPPDCGNGDIDQGEDCDGANLDDQTCQSIDGDFAGGDLACSDDCTFDTTGCTTAPETCGNGDIDAGEDCDGVNLDEKTCTTISGGFTGGSLACNDDCTFDVGLCELPPSDAIARVIDNLDVPDLSLLVSGVYVTYLIPGIGNLANNPAGFTLQAEQGGPAIFVAVDPDALTPVPAVGDEVSLVVTAAVLTNGQPRITALTDFSRLTQGNNVSLLVQEVSDATDLLSDLDGYTSELITVTVAVTSDFTAAGNGFVAADVTTDAITTPPLPRLRVPISVREALGLEDGCLLEISETPLWRFQAEAQISAWRVEDVTAGICNAPQVISAAALSANSVSVTFNRSIDAGSILASGTQFAISDGTDPLAITAAAATGPATVTLTTADQGAGTQYTVTVDDTVEDIFGEGVDLSNNTADFRGYVAFLAQLYLWEVDADTPSTDEAEFIEIWNHTGSTLDFSTSGDRFFVLFVNGNGDSVYRSIQLTGTLADDGVLVLGNSAVPNVSITFPNNTLQNGVDGVLLVSCPSCPNDGEFTAAVNLTVNPTFSSLNGHTATKLDAICYDNANRDDAGLRAVLGVDTCWNEGGGGNGMSNRRITTDTWTTGSPTPGVK